MKKRYLLALTLILAIGLSACGSPQPASPPEPVAPSGGEVPIGTTVHDVVQSGPSGTWTTVTTTEQPFTIGEHVAKVKLADTGNLQIAYTNANGSNYKYFFLEDKDNGSWYVSSDTTYDFGSNPEWYARFGVATDFIYARLSDGVWQVSK